MGPSLAAFLVPFDILGRTRTSGQCPPSSLAKRTSVRFWTKFCLSQNDLPLDRDRLIPISVCSRDALPLTDDSSLP